MTTRSENLIDLDDFNGALGNGVASLPKSLQPPRVRSVAPATKPNDAIDGAKRAGSDRLERRHRRYPYESQIELCVMAGDRPLPGAFVVQGLDISRSGMRVVGAAPLLAGAKIAMLLTRQDGQRALVGGVVRHSGFGSAALTDGQGNCAAGIEFEKIEDSVVSRYFVGPTGQVALPEN